MKSGIAEKWNVPQRTAAFCRLLSIEILRGFINDFFIYKYWCIALHCKCYCIAWPAVDMSFFAVLTDHEIGVKGHVFKFRHYYPLQLYVKAVHDITD